MKPFVLAVLFFFIGIHHALGQDSFVLISAKMFDPDQKIVLSAMNGWVFKKGNNTSWAEQKINTDDWDKIKPTQLSAALADRSGRVEGWFRCRIKLDHDVASTSLSIGRGGWAATDLYIDGNLVFSFGNTSIDTRTYKEYNPIDKLFLPINWRPGEDHILALHFVDYIAPLSFGLLKSATIGATRSQSQGLSALLAFAGPKYNLSVSLTSRETLVYRTVWISVTIFLALLSWLLFFLNEQEKKNLMLISIYCSFSAMQNLTRIFLNNEHVSFLTYRLNDLLFKGCGWMLLVLTFIIAKKILNFKNPRSIKSFLIVYSFVGTFSIFFNWFNKLLYASVIASFLFYAYILVSDRKKLKGSQWSIVAGLSLPGLFMVLFIIFNFNGYNSNNWQLLLTGVYFSFPLSLLVYISLRFREIIRETQEKAHQVVEITKEREEQVLKQQKIHKELLELEAQALRAQMNPHFIYNCMNSIKALIQNNEKRQSIEYLTSFSKLIRTLFQNSDKRQISLYDEIETCRLYVQLESMRLNGKLKYEFIIEPDLDLKSVMVPAMIVQPFIENAIWHGIVPKDGGVINVSVKRNEDNITCEVDDDGIGRERSRLNKPFSQVTHVSKGVHLSRQRLDLEKVLNHNYSSIEIIDKVKNNLATGTRVILTFNLN